MRCRHLFFARRSTNDAQCAIRTLESNDNQLSLRWDGAKWQAPAAGSARLSNISSMCPKPDPPGYGRSDSIGRNGLRQDRRSVAPGRGHARPGSVERACQIDRPAAGLDEHGGKTEPAGVHGGVVNTKVGREPGQEDSLQAALAQVTGQTGRRTPIVFKECGEESISGRNPLRITSSARSVANCG